MRNTRTLFIAFVIIMLSCSNPYKSFEKGNFEKAYASLLRDFEKGQYNRKAGNIFNRSFGEMLGKNETLRALSDRSRDVLDYEHLYHESEELILNYIKGKRWLDDEFEVSISEIERAQDSLAVSLASFYVDEADSFLSEYDYSGNKAAAQEAFLAYEKAIEYNGADYVLDSLIEVSRQAATVYILFESKVWDFDLQWVVDRRFEEIENRSRKFREVYYEKIPEHLDCHVMVEFGALDVDLSERTETDNYSKEIIVSHETYKDSLGKLVEKPIYKTVKASVECRIRTKSYFWEARTSIDPAHNYCNFQPRSFASEFVAESKSFVTRGDERALPEDMRNLVDVGFAYKEERVIADLVEDIYNQFERSYF